MSVDLFGHADVNVLCCIFFSRGPAGSGHWREGEVLNGIDGALHLSGLTWVVFWIFIVERCWQAHGDWNRILEEIRTLKHGGSYTNCVR